MQIVCNGLHRHGVICGDVTDMHAKTADVGRARSAQGFAHATRKVRARCVKISRITDSRKVRARSFLRHFVYTSDS